MKSSNFNHIRVIDLTVIAVMVAVLEVAKISLSFLPNIELVSLLFILFTLEFGLSLVLPACFIFVLVEALIWGFGIWTIQYLYVWPILILLTNFLKRYHDKWVFVILSSVFGLLFGMLCSFVMFLIGSPNVAFAWWIAGIPYDLLHCAGNFVVAAVLYVPLSKVLHQITGRIYRSNMQQVDKKIM